MKTREQELETLLKKLYYAGYWTCDRPVDEKSLWEEVRDTLGLPEGTSPKRIGE